MIVAGEASGDLHGAHLVRALRREAPGLFVCGIGGDHLRAEGVRILLDASRLAVVGITEVLAKLPVVWQALGLAKKLLHSLRPDLLILIDFPDFNLRVARMAKKRGIPVLYYVSPQIWAWRRGRVQTIKQRVDHMAVILPFEDGFYQAHGVPVNPVKPRMCREWPFIRSVARHPENWFSMAASCPGMRTEFSPQQIAQCVERILAASGDHAGG